jgi:hypothetical protein
MTGNAVIVQRERTHRRLVEQEAIHTSPFLGLSDTRLI